MNSSGYFKSGCWIIAVPMIISSIALCAGADDFVSVFLMLGLIVFALLIALIFWLFGTVKAVKETYVAVRDAIIDIFTVKREIRQKCPEALKAMILEKKKNSVKVGVFDYKDKMYETVTISGNGTVNADIYEGLTITL